MLSEMSPFILKISGMASDHPAKNEGQIAVPSFFVAVPDAFYLQEHPLSPSYGNVPTFTHVFPPLLVLYQSRG
jgi:hypothetical protein